VGGDAIITTETSCCFHISKLFPFIPRHEELQKCNLIVQFQDLFVERTHHLIQHNPWLFPFIPRHEELQKCNLIVQFQDLFVERTHHLIQHNP
jgi:hypothetical protein